MQKDVFEGKGESRAHECYQQFMDTLSNATEAVRFTARERAADQYVRILAVTAEAYKTVEVLYLKCHKNFIGTHDKLFCA